MLSVATARCMKIHHYHTLSERLHNENFETWIYLILLFLNLAELDFVNSKFAKSLKFLFWGFLVHAQTHALFRDTNVDKIWSLYLYSVHSIQVRPRVSKASLLSFFYSGFVTRYWPVVVHATHVTCLKTFAKGPCRQTLCLPHMAWNRKLTYLD